MIWIRLWSFIVVLLCIEIIRICKSQSDGRTPNVITWDDLSVKSGGVRVIVVDRNGGGQAKTISAAIQMVPNNNKKRVKIHLLPGTYNEKVLFPPSKPYISLIGDPNHPDQTLITGHVKATDPGVNGTVYTANVVVASDYFCASGITFQNTGVGAQAVALRAVGDRAVFYKVRFLGTQDTLMPDKGSHYFFQCFIHGAVDFICGNGRSLFQTCSISVSVHGGAIAAQRRDRPYDNTGFSFVDCTITANGTPYLGRAWGNHSRVIYARCKLDINDVMLGGWYNWGDVARQKTVVLGEYKSSGKGAHTKRVPWAKSFSDKEAKQYLDTKFIDGQYWLKL